MLAAGLVFSVAAQAQKAERIPPPATILKLAKGLKFDAERVTGGPVNAAYAPQFSIDTAFRAKMVDLHPIDGAVAAKVSIRGVPTSYRIPDGSYYLWIGKAPDRLRSALVRMDGRLQVELCTEELPQTDEPRTHSMTDREGPLPCDVALLAQAALPGGGGVPKPLPPKPPQNGSKPKPAPPRTQKRTIQDICYTENGNSPVTKYRKGVVYVPDS